MKTIKTIIIILGFVVNLGFYATFFLTSIDESGDVTTCLLLLIAAMSMSILINQLIHELKDN